MIIGGGLPTVSNGDLVVLIVKLKVISYLILSESEESWLVNNRIDLETWDTIYD